MYQMGMEYANCLWNRQNGPTKYQHFRCSSFQNLPKFAFLVRKYSIWQHRAEMRTSSHIRVNCVQHLCTYVFALRLKLRAANSINAFNNLSLHMCDHLRDSNLWTNFDDNQQIRFVNPNPKMSLFASLIGCYESRMYADSKISYYV
jgi:hypothetical protein